MKKKLKLAIPVVFLGVILFIFFALNLREFCESPWEQPRLYARLFGLIAALMVLFELASMGRGRFLAKFIPPANLAKTHRIVGLLLVFPITIHIILVQFGKAPTLPLGEKAASEAWGNFAVAGVVILGIMIGFALLFIMKKLSFPKWRPTHYLVFPAILLIFWHQIFYGQDFINHLLFKILWSAIWAIVISELVFKKVRKI